MAKFFKERSIVVSWLISYALICTLALSFYFIIWKNFENGTIDKNNRYNIELLNNDRQRVDTIKRDAVTSLISLTVDRDIKELTVSEQILGQDYEKLEDIHQRLILSVTNSEYINEIFVYLHSADYVIGARTGNFLEGYWMAYYTQYNQSYEEFKNLLMQKHYCENILIEEKETGKKKVLLMNTIYTVAINEPVATAVVEVDYENYMDKFSSVEGMQLFIFGKDDVLLAASEGQFCAEKLGELMEENVDNERIYNSEDVVVLTLLSEEDRGRYVYAIEKSKYLESITTARTRMLFLLILYMGICGFFIGYMIKRNYQPIKAMIQNIDQTMNPVHNVRNKNELAYINKILSDVISTNAKQHEMMKSKDEIIRKIAITKLLKNEKLAKNVEKEALKGLQVDLSGRYIILACSIDHTEQIFLESGEKDNVDNASLAKMIVSNMLGDLLDGFQKEYFEIDDMPGFLINTSTGDFSEYMGEIGKKFFDLFDSYFCFDVAMFFSGEHTGETMLPVCWSEIYKCLEDNFGANRRMVYFNELDQSNRYIFKFAFENEIQLLHALRNQDELHAVEIVNGIFEENTNSKNMSLQSAKGLVYAISSILVKAANEQGTACGDFLQMYNVFERLEHCKTIFSTRGELIKIIREFCQFPLEQKQSKAGEIAEQVDEFIKYSYDNPDLSGAMIEEQFQVGYSYISKMFKKYKKIGISDYIVELRVKKAIELMQNTNYTIKEISELVGYTNVRSFSRVFTKLTGCAPGKYKSFYSEQKEE